MEGEPALIVKKSVESFSVTLILNRPKRGNAITPGLGEALRLELFKIEKDPEVFTRNRFNLRFGLLS
jgi:hypothetical protein